MFCILLKWHDRSERWLGSWWEGGVWDTLAPAKREGHSFLQVLLAVPQPSLAAQRSGAFKVGGD